MAATSFSSLPLGVRPGVAHRERLVAPVLRERRRAAGKEVGVAELARARRMRSLLALLSLYAVTLVVVMTAADGPDVGCILAAIAGHVLHSSSRLAVRWREAARLEALARVAS